MRRLAFFVEGKTEAIFVEKLIKEIAGNKKIFFRWQEISGGRTAPCTIRTIRITGQRSESTHYILVYDCGGDHQVKSRILENIRPLSTQNYSLIIGIRDIYPTITRHEITKFRTEIAKGFTPGLTPVDFILAEMEIEAWFLAEHTHFGKIDSRLTPANIFTHLGFNPSSDDMSLRDEPANDLRSAYGIHGKSYSKSTPDRTINALDYEQIYLHTRDTIPDLNRLINHIEQFIFPSH